MMKQTQKLGLVSLTCLLILFTFINQYNHLVSYRFNTLVPAAVNRRNCCKEICELDVLSPSTMMMAGSKCPGEYLIFSPYSGFNNKLVVYVEALLLAARLQRTVVLVDEWLDTGRSWNSSLVHDDLCVKFMTRRQVEESVQDTNRPVRSVYWGNPSCTSTLGDFETNRVQLDSEFLNRYRKNVTYPTKYPKIGCVADNLPLFQDDALLFLPCPYFMSIDKQSYMNALKHIRISEKISAIGDAIIQKLFQDRPFVGVHLRNFEGQCRHAINVIFTEVNSAKPFLEQALHTCDMSWSFIKDQFRDKSGINVDQTPVFLSSDNQVKETTAALLQHENVKMLTNDIFSEYPEIDLLLLDMYILSKSAAFLGNPYSSLSFHVLLWREINGFSLKTNIQPGYREIGMLYHLFK